jgi:hypothetical protein
MKQTAVEWFAKEVLRSRQLGFISNEKFNELLEQAKEMEREQIIEARNNGFMASGEGWNGEYGIEDINLLTQEIKSEQYYDETFK